MTDVAQRTTMLLYTYIFCLVSLLTADENGCNTDVMTVDKRKHKSSEGNVYPDIPSIINPARIFLACNPGLHGEKPKTYSQRNDTDSLLFIVRKCAFYPLFLPDYHSTHVCDAKPNNTCIKRLLGVRSIF